MTKVVHLEEEDATVFSYIFEWVYSEKIMQSDLTKAVSENDRVPSPTMWIEIHKVADYLGIIPLCDYAMRQLYDLYTQKVKYLKVDQPSTSPISSSNVMTTELFRTHHSASGYLTCSLSHWRTLTSH